MKTKPAPHLQILQSVKASDARLRSTELSRYAGFRAEVTSSLAEVLKTKLFDDNRIHHLLNGGASIALREQVSRETRSKYGMFFSSQSLASAVADLIQHRIIKGAVLADPACGADDLLLACLARAPLHAVERCQEQERRAERHEQVAERWRIFPAVEEGEYRVQEIVLNHPGLRVAV